MAITYDVKTTQKKLNNEALIDRRMDVSGEMAEYVYKYEKNINKLMGEKTSPGDLSPTWEQMQQKAIESISPSQPNTRIVDSMYDQETGIAALAVEDELTGETYISYAGTNMDADGAKDIISDVRIGVNDSLGLRQLGDKATSFYDRVQSSGANITVTTGHSYGDFLASRVAIERQVPYKFGYQGAPQTVTDVSASESLLNISSVLSDEYLRFHNPVARVVQLINPSFSPTGFLNGWISDRFDSKKKLQAAEYDRVQGLLKDYSGYAVTFSTTGDQLTNVTWKQGDSQINFHGQEQSFGIFNPLVNYLKGKLVEKYDHRISGAYPGQVLAIDIPVPHDMSAFREKAMATAKVMVAQEISGVDVDSDGTLDFLVTSDYTRTDSLLPASAKSSSGGIEIKVNPSDLRALSSNMGVVLAQVGDLIVLTTQAVSSNEGVQENVTGRRDNLKTKISEHLESISLIQAIKDVDGAYKDLSDIKSDLNTVASYDIGGFTGHFNWLNYATKNFYEGASGPLYAYSKTSGPLTTAMTSVSTLKSNVESSLDDSAWTSNNSNSSTSNGLVSLGSQTKIGNEGEGLINSFEEKIEKATKGTGRRDALEDGIPDALNELLPVIAQNLYTVYQCIEYLIAVVDNIASTMETTDANLSSGIEAFDFSGISEVTVTTPTDYQAFLEESAIFDDMKTMKAYDDQVDTRASLLATDMSTSFTSWFEQVKGLIEASNTALAESMESLPNITGQFSTDIYWASKDDDRKSAGLAANIIGAVYADITGHKAKRTKLGSIESLISISSTLKSLEEKFPDIDTKLTTAATTINTAVSYFGGFKEVFQPAMEDTIYGLNNLEGVVSSQQAVHEVLVAINTRFTEFQSQLSNSKGAAIDSLKGKVDSSVLTMGHVTQLLSDCFM